MTKGNAALQYDVGTGPVPTSYRHGFFASKKVKNNKLEEVEPRLILLHNQQALIF